MKTPRFPHALTALALLLAALTPANSQQSPADALHAWLSVSDPAGLERWVESRIAASQTDIDKLTSVSGARTVENTLRPFDDAENELAIASSNAMLLYALSDAAPMRDKGQAMAAKVSSVASNLSLNQKVYAALSAIPLPTADPATTHYLERTLLEYRLSGVDQDEATRKRIHDLLDKITDQSLVFGRNVQDGKLTITASKAELDGLPADFVARLKTNAEGSYILTTDEPDVQPVLSFAKSASLRRRMLLAYNQRAYPKNGPVLLEILQARQDLATTLGYPRFADLATADQMIGSAAGVHKLIEDVDLISHETARKEYSRILAFAQKEDASRTTISQADSRYWGELYRRAN